MADLFICNWLYWPHGHFIISDSLRFKHSNLFASDDKSIHYYLQIVVLLIYGVSKGIRNYSFVLLLDRFSDNDSIEQIFSAFFDIIKSSNFYDLKGQTNDFNHRCEWTAGNRAPLSFG